MKDYSYNLGLQCYNVCIKFGTKKNLLVKLVIAILGVFVFNNCSDTEKNYIPVLDESKLRKYVKQFNTEDEELYANISNKDAFKFLQKNIPLFECPDTDFERTYYFRWWTYRKHIKKTEDGYVITEFLPDVPWSGKHNTISCPAAHHFYEGRWLHNAEYLDDYSYFWLRKGGEPRLYSFWIADAFYNRYLVTFDNNFLLDLLPDLIENYRKWETGWDWKGYHIGQRKNGLFYTIDDRDGGELSIGGHGFRPTLNSFMFGDAMAISRIANLTGKQDLERKYRSKASKIKKLVQEKLWDSESQFFKVLPKEGEELKDARELYGYTPWYFNMPDSGYEEGWKELMDKKGFYAPYGPTFLEQRHPDFNVSYEGHECQWNGPSWPLATCNVLTSLANLLNNYKQNVISKEDYFETLKTYTNSHKRNKEDGKVVPWIDENLNPYTGDWISRTRLESWDNGNWSIEKGGKERGKDYNHSTYNDLIITGLLGLRPRNDDMVKINPLIPQGKWDYFCLDNVLYHGHILTIVWDKTGEKYKRGKGLMVFIDGKLRAHTEHIEQIIFNLRK